MVDCKLVNIPAYDVTTKEHNIKAGYKSMVSAVGNVVSLTKEHMLFDLTNFTAHYKGYSLYFLNFMLMRGE